MCGAIPLLPQYAFMAWYLIKHRDFTFLLSRVRRLLWRQNEVTCLIFAKRIISGRVIKDENTNTCLNVDSNNRQEEEHAQGDMGTRERET
jgi:hypothetical protein